MRTIAIDEVKHKKLKLKCIENDLQLTELIDEILEHIFATGDILEVIEDAIKRKKIKEAEKKKRS